MIKAIGCIFVLAREDFFTRKKGSKLSTYKFFLKGALYEMMLEVRKDITRFAYAYIQIEIVAGTPPLMQITCGDPALCKKDENGQVFINPTTRQV